jgi:hypothetical protein
LDGSVRLGSEITLQNPSLLYMYKKKVSPLCLVLPFARNGTSATEKNRRGELCVVQLCVRWLWKIWKVQRSGLLLLLGFPKMRTAIFYCRLA